MIIIITYLLYGFGNFLSISRFWTWPMSIVRVCYDGYRSIYKKYKYTKKFFTRLHALIAGVRIYATCIDPIKLILFILSNFSSSILFEFYNIISMITFFFFNYWSSIIHTIYRTRWIKFYGWKSWYFKFSLTLINTTRNEDMTFCLDVTKKKILYLVHTLNYIIIIPTLFACLFIVYFSFMYSCAYSWYSWHEVGTHSEKTF